jgi:prephenate dehydrogenase
MPLAQLTVIGAGLIGGSVCLAARRAGLAEHIVAIDRTPDRTRTDVADAWLDASDVAAVGAALARSELTVLCTPVGIIIDSLPAVLARTPGVVTDAGSTKVRVAGAARALADAPRFVPGHPMAGRPDGGLLHAEATLFDGRTWILCPASASNASSALVRSFVIGCGATPIDLEPEVHDHSVAYTSHLPQVVASALSVLATEAKATAAAGPGFASATRVAGGAAAMWRDIFETNGAEIGAALRDLGGRLDSLGRELERGDSGPLVATLDEARRLRRE